MSDDSKTLSGGCAKKGSSESQELEADKGDEGKDLVLLDPLKYPVQRGQEELYSIEKTMQLINKRDPTLLKRYRSDPHKISRVVMREVRPKNGFNHEKAARFYQETVEWRETFHCEHMLRYPPGKLHIMNMLIPELNFDCFDKHGNPVLYMRFGLGTGKQCLARLSVQEWAMCHAYCLDLMELMCRMQTKRTGRWVDKMRVVIDFENISIFALRDFLGYAKRCAHMDTTYYTGLMLSTHLVNVPASLSWATALFWPFLSAGVKRKVFLFTTGFEGALQKLIPPESLPKQYGGKREWSYKDPNKMDWKAYDQEVRRVAYKNMDVKSVILKTGSKHSETVTFEAGTQIDYFFETNMTSVYFEAIVEYDGKTKPVHAVERSTRKSNAVPERSWINLYHNGKITFRWVNHGGWGSRVQTLRYALAAKKVKIQETDGCLGHLRLIQ